LQAETQNPNNQFDSLRPLNMGDYGPQFDAIGALNPFDFGRDRSSLKRQRLLFRDRIPSNNF
jgi:hypothetical protein